MRSVQSGTWFCPPNCIARMPRKTYAGSPAAPQLLQEKEASGVLVVMAAAPRTIPAGALWNVGCSTVPATISGSPWRFSTSFVATGQHHAVVLYKPRVTFIVWWINGVDQWCTCSTIWDTVSHRGVPQNTFSF